MSWASLFKRHFLLFTGLVVLAFFLATVLTWWNRPSSPPLPSYNTVAPFTFIDQNGRPFTSRDLEGKIWIANFIFTRCPGPCLALTQNFHRFQEQLQSLPNVEFVSFTVDPEFDTPSILKEYATLHQAPPERWHFLTGNKKEIYDLIHHRFHLIAQQNPSPSPGYEFIHTEKIALVDPYGRVRQYYNGLDEASYRQLLQDIHSLHSTGSP